MGFNLSISRQIESREFQREDWFDVRRHAGDEAFYTWLRDNAEYREPWSSDFYLRPKNFVAAVVTIYHEVPVICHPRLLDALEKMAHEPDLWFHASY